MKEIHISIFNPDNLRLNELYCKLNRYTAKITADPFEPYIYFHVNEADIFTEKLELQCLLYDSVITYTFPNMSIENLYVCITILLSFLRLKETKREEDMICLSINNQDDGNVTLTTYYLYITHFLELYLESFLFTVPFSSFATLLLQTFSI